MRRLRLRGRVAAAAVVAIVAAVVLLGVIVLARLDGSLRGSLDDSLRARAAEVARINASTPRLLTAPGALEGRLGGGTLFVQVLDDRGRIVARSGALGGRVLPDDATVRGALRGRRAGYADDGLGADPIRLYAAPLGEFGSGPAAGGAVVVAGTTGDIEDTLASTRRFVVLGGLGAAVLAALLALALTGRALRPLTRLSAGAREIERTGDATRRLPPDSAHDEVGELARTLNAMLDSLERAREAEQRFVGDASHELRTPLTALRGNIGYLQRHGADPALIADLAADAERLTGLLDDLLALAREDAAAPAAGTEVDLTALATEVAATDPDAVAEVPDEPVLVRGERPALERAVGNLVANARRHGPPGGRITVTVAQRGATATISVSDEGTGLEPEEAALAFQRFWRGERARGTGSGLGLAIVRAIAERHGGRARVDGATFTIELPAVTEVSRPARTTTA